MYTALLAQKINKGGSGGEAELSGVPPLTFRSNGTPLLDYLISGNTVQSGTPSPTTPIMPEGTGDRTANLLNNTATAKPYEPYGYKIPISCGGQTTNVYLGEVQSTRRINKLVLTGEESWGRNSGNSVLYLAISDGGADNTITSMCNEYPAAANVTAYANMTDKSICIKSDGSAIWIKNTDITSVTNFKTYLQQQYANGTPVTIWYVLATPTTGIVNEPLMKIGTYADSVSMEQAGVQIPTNNGTTVIDVNTTLKPSEIYIKYHTR